jgi:branched-chain amino acid transport system substrate-binding protein
MTHPFLHRTAAAGLAAIVLLLAACQKQADNTITVGEYASLTGSEADFGQSSHMGTQLAIDQVNAAGGVLGKKLELITEDNGSKPGESATIAQKLISRDKAVALLGEVASGRSLEVAPICQADKIPMISPSSTNPAVTLTGDYIFRVCFIDPFQGQVLARFAKDTLKVRRVASLIAVSSAYSVGLEKYFKEPFEAAGGQVVLEQKYSNGDKDFKAQLTAINAAHVDALFIPGYYSDVALICIQARELGLHCAIFGGDGWEGPELVQIGGAAIDGCYYSTHYSATNPAPIVQDFVKKFAAAYQGKVPDSMAALGYDSALVLIDAIKRAGTTDGPALRDAIAATKDFEGVTGRTMMDASRNASKPAVVVQVVKGQAVLVQSYPP